jgi:hypothetical protein
MRKLGLCVLATAITLGALSAPAVADDTECFLGIPVGTYDNIVVPEGGDCVLTNTVVRGNVKVRRGASLFSTNNDIGGNIDGDRPRWVGSLGDRIGGNFSVTGATGPGFGFMGLSVNAFLCLADMPNGNVKVQKSQGTIAVGSLIPECAGNNVANGNIQLQDNFIPPLELMTVARNFVDGNLQVFKNRGPGQKTVAENTVTQNLQCRRNDEPFVGGPNVARKAEGQCFAGGP